ncbi:MAG: hybrid sensor histidine kinase/response regulator, partial [Candidatus Omnitrophica bacterium]|nr:hybrid sensor histidine kinase/response regulator [Candidatus Omnitrophota bacterium]
SGDLNKTIQSVVENQESVAKARGLSMSYSLDPSMPTVSFDADKIVQVLNNLISNALKFTESGGVTVKSKYIADKNFVEVGVEDTGCGIKNEDLGKLFEKFQQLGESHRKYSGTGLGLAICREIIRQHNGKISVESKYGQGSCFCFMFPVSVRGGNAV